MLTLGSEHGSHLLQQMNPIVHTYEMSSRFRGHAWHILARWEGRQRGGKRSGRHGCGVSRPVLEDMGVGEVRQEGPDGA